MTNIYIYTHITSYNIAIHFLLIIPHITAAPVPGILHRFHVDAGAPQPDLENRPGEP